MQRSTIALAPPVVCAWCVDAGRIAQPAGDNVSHGICESCSRAFLQQAGLEPVARPRARVLPFRGRQVVNAQPLAPWLLAEALNPDPRD